MNLIPWVLSSLVTNLVHTVLLPKEPDFSNMSDPSVVIELPGNNWRSDNNNNNNRQIPQTSLSGRRSRRDQSRDKHRSKKRRRRRSASTSSSSTSTSSDSHKRKWKRSKHSHRKRRRRYTSPSFSDNQVHDYGRYQRNRYCRPQWLSWMRHPTGDQEVAGSTPATFFPGDWSWNIFYGHSVPSPDSRRAVVSFWRKNVHNTG